MYNRSIVHASLASPAQRWGRLERHARTAEIVPRGKHRRMSPAETPSPRLSALTPKHAGSAVTCTNRSEHSIDSFVIGHRGEPAISHAMVTGSGCPANVSAHRPALRRADQPAIWLMDGDLFFRYDGTRRSHKALSNLRLKQARSLDYPGAACLDSAFCRAAGPRLQDR